MFSTHKTKGFSKSRKINFPQFYRSYISWQAFWLRALCVFYTKIGDKSLAEEEGEVGGQVGNPFSKAGGGKSWRERRRESFQNLEGKLHVNIFSKTGGEIDVNIFSFCTPFLFSEIGVL